MNNDSRLRSTNGFARNPKSMTIATAVLAAIAIVALDQISKAVIFDSIGPNADRRIIELIPGLRLIFVRNTGSAFGLFQGQSSILTFMTFVAIGLLALYFIRSARNDPLVAAALGLMLGGAVGNLIDRLRLGYVVDWIDVLRWPTFNIADSAITIGVVVLLYAVLLRDLTPSAHTSSESDDEIELAAEGSPGDES